jgi:hypothetical protein
MLLDKKKKQVFCILKSGLPPFKVQKAENG